MLVPWCDGKLGAGRMVVLAFWHKKVSAVVGMVVLARWLDKKDFESAAEWTIVLAS